MGTDDVKNGVWLHGISVINLIIGLSLFNDRNTVKPPRHRFFLVSLCLQENAEMVPQFPSCYYMPLM